MGAKTTRTGGQRKVRAEECTDKPSPPEKKPADSGMGFERFFQGWTGFKALEPRCFSAPLNALSLSNGERSDNVASQDHAFAFGSSAATDTLDQL